MSGIQPTLIDYKPQRWQAQCPRCGYFHKGHNADMARDEAERCEKICRSQGVPLEAYQKAPYDMLGNRAELANEERKV